MAALADSHAYASGGAAAAAAASAPSCDPAGAPPSPDIWTDPPPPPVHTEEEAAAVAQWSWAKVGRVAVAADALELFNRTFAHALAAPAADRAALMSGIPLFAGCSRPASAAVEGMSRLGAPGLQAYENILLGLRFAEPILVRLALARAPPRVVKEVLAAWLQEAAARMREPSTLAWTHARARCWAPTRPSCRPARAGPPPASSA